MDFSADYMKTRQVMYLTSNVMYIIRLAFMLDDVKYFH